MHWTNSSERKGKLVRTDRINGLVTITPMMNPTVDFSQHGVPIVVCPDAGERGDRKRPKDIRVPVPPALRRLKRMWIAGLQPDQSPVACTRCGQEQHEGDDATVVCCNCLLSWHAACVEQNYDILQSRKVPVTPRPPPDGFPAGFHGVLCKLRSLWLHVKKGRA